MINSIQVIFNNKNKMTIKNAFRRGFTLIELMIVIVILGILMGTILPRLTGAQSRARDTARIADLNNISQALEVYSSDFGEYPDAACANADYGANCLNVGCTDPNDTYEKLAEYLKGNRVPQNVGKQTDTLGCVGSYYYSSLKSGGTTNQSYVLASDLETWQMANYAANSGLLTDPGGADEFGSGDEAGDHIDNIVEQITKPLDGHSEKNSIYIVIP